MDEKQGKIRFIIFLAVFFLVILSPLYLGLILFSPILAFLAAAAVTAGGLYYIIKLAVIAALKETRVKIERESVPNTSDPGKDRETS